MSDKTEIRATVKYKSGREETFCGNLKTNGSAYKSFEDKVDMFRSFPTVTTVETEKF